MDIQNAIDALSRYGHLNADQAESVMRQIMTGGASDAQIGAYLMALSMKGETTDEISGSARAMRDAATTVPTSVEVDMLDTCGTGGDRSGTFNISTTVAFVAAGAGIPVAKHGNRAATSKSGSADVLAALGVNFDLTPAQVGAQHRRGRHRLPVRAHAASSDAPRHRSPPRTRHQDHIQYLGSADQPRRRPAPTDGCIRP